MPICTSLEDKQQKLQHILAVNTHNHGSPLQRHNRINEYKNPRLDSLKTAPIQENKILWSLKEARRINGWWWYKADCVESPAGRAKITWSMTQLLALL